HKFWYELRQASSLIKAAWPIDFVSKFVPQFTRWLLLPFTGTLPPLQPTGGRATGARGRTQNPSIGIAPEEEGRPLIPVSPPPPPRPAVTRHPWPVLDADSDETPPSTSTCSDPGLPTGWRRPPAPRHTAAPAAGRSALRPARFGPARSRRPTARPVRRGA